MESKASGIICIDCLVALDEALYRGDGALHPMCAALEQVIGPFTVVVVAVLTVGRDGLQGRTIAELQPNLAYLMDHCVIFVLLVAGLHTR